MNHKIKLPKLLIYFMFFYFGTTSVMLLTGKDLGNEIFYKVIWIVTLSIWNAVGMYGLINIIEHLRTEGIPFVVRKIRRFFNL